MVGGELLKGIDRTCLCLLLNQYASTLYAGNIAFPSPAQNFADPCNGERKQLAVLVRLSELVFGDVFQKCLAVVLEPLFTDALDFEKLIQR